MQQPHRLLLAPALAGLLGCVAPGARLAEEPSAAVVPLASALEVYDDGSTVLFNGRDLTGWRPLEGFDYEKPAKVRVEDGAIVLGTGGPMTGIAWKGEFPRGNYEVELEGKRVEGGDFFCGMTFPVAGSHATLILGGWGGEVVGISNIDYYSAADNTTTQIITFEMNRWYSIRLRLDEKIRVWLDGELLIDHETEGHKFEVWPQQEPARPFGITTWMTTGAVRRITVRPLEPLDK